MPTPSNLAELILQLAKYEFCTKVKGITSLVFSGIPDNHRCFWKKLGVEGVAKLYASLTVTNDKVLDELDCDFANPAEERVFGYLTTMIGNMPVNDLRNFLRFTTGSSVCVSKNIKVIFNDSSGLGRSPFANTCGSTLHLPVSYLNYQDFSTEWTSILSDTDSKWKWCMDEY